MTTPHQLCTLDPAAPVRTAVGPFPAIRSTGDPATWTAPDGHAYLPIVAADAPVYDPETEKLVGAPDAVIDGQFVTGRYRVEPLTLEEIAALARKTWPNAAAFLAEFSMPELAAISLSTDPTVAALRLLLLAWPSDVWSEDPRIVGGLAALVAAGIIDETRKAAIVAKD